ncbi:MAG TPA: NAD-dependent epimerase/dehydratase family protein [Candidatus Pullichristensenella excrementigallinarum]|uniref:NAD-dependent epimerase/dehydratase family protein n=1 Tax=Candidatus Pullichristensenella excrementigallinarum TaxID=2840907 RepID=A0A9D1IDG8_9FIRM|nr:NAD-dependent epimerase/dehydratase family protein [Candidatus Pullichristensenella excrementigallinarum]
MIRVLIAGKGSFIGTALLARLRAFPDRFEAREMDLRDPAWRDADFSSFDCVVHVAGVAHVSHKKSMEPIYARVNRDLAVECAKKAREAGVGQFIFLSSANIYGPAARPGRNFVIGPDALPAPGDAYARTKWEAEQALMQMEAESFRIARVRPMMVYGANGRGNYRLLSKFARSLPLFPDFPNAHGAVYVEHLAELLRLLIEDRASGAFCAQDESAHSTADFVREIARAHGRRMFFPRTFNPLLRLFGNLSILRRAFGGFAYSPEAAHYRENYRVCSFSEAIARTERIRPS